MFSFLSPHRESIADIIYPLLARVKSETARQCGFTETRRLPATECYLAPARGRRCYGNASTAPLLRRYAPCVGLVAAFAEVQAPRAFPPTPCGLAGCIGDRNQYDKSTNGDRKHRARYLQPISYLIVTNAATAPTLRRLHQSPSSTSRATGYASCYALARPPTLRFPACAAGFF